MTKRQLAKEIQEVMSTSLRRSCLIFWKEGRGYKVAFSEFRNGIQIRSDPSGSLGSLGK